MLMPLILSLAITAGCLLAGRILIHYFQLESYQFPGYFRTIRRNLLRAILTGVCMSLILIVSTILFTRVFHADGWLFCVCSGIILICSGLLTGRFFSEKKAKKALAYTPRIKRLYAVSVVVMTLILFISCRMIVKNGSVAADDTLFPALILFFPALLPLWIALCGLAAWPIEKLISELYFRDAQRILKSRNDLIRIGITGSWGKTSVKFILGTILEEKYHTLITPASFNTPMGVTKVIRTSLEPSHRVFVSEMGARHVGDIREMCRLVHPHMGVITSVGPQHLDTFRTVERVARTKYELIEALPADGSAFFADDQGICRELYEKTKIDKTLTGMDREADSIWAEGVSYSPEGSRFLLCSGEQSIECRTRLLGELNIRNILLASAVAMKLGMPLEQISRGIGKIKPVEHRLQLTAHPGGLSVIDDAFNSNIQGAKQAFQVLGQFPQKRIVVTPGMVELGNREYEMNREFGASMADCCDTAILVGRKRSAAIAEGLKENGFPMDSIHIVSSLEEATVLLRQICAPGDTVLFENDLPDNYTES